MRLKGIKKVTVKRGRKTYTYYRHRATGTRLKAEPNTAAFAVEVDALDARAAATRDPGPGTWGQLAEKYRQSPEWTDQLAPRTRKDYMRVFTYLEPVNSSALSSLSGARMYEIRDAAFAKHKRRFSTYVVQVMRLVLEWGKQREFIDANPAKGVKAIRRPKHLPRSNRAWTDAEREIVLERAPEQLKVAIALGMFAGLRQGDALRLPWSAYKESVIQTMAQKTGERLWIPAHFRLRAVLERASKASPVIAVNLKGQPWTESGFRASFFKFLGKLEKAGVIGHGLTFHGLRHTVGKLVIDAGGDTRDVQSILGHRSEASRIGDAATVDMLIVRLAELFLRHLRVSAVDTQPTLAFGIAAPRLHLPTRREQGLRKSDVPTQGHQDFSSQLGSRTVRDYEMHTRKKGWLKVSDLSARQLLWFRDECDWSLPGPNTTSRNEATMDDLKMRIEVEIAARAQEGRL